MLIHGLIRVFIIHGNYGIVLRLHVSQRNFSETLVTSVIFTKRIVTINCEQRGRMSSFNVALRYFFLLQLINLKVSKTDST